MIYPPTDRKPKASDIPDTAFLEAVRRISTDGLIGTRSRWVFVSEMAEEFSPFPYKVVLAKFRQLVKRGLLDGCPCGCRGDIELTQNGALLLTLNEEREG